jgi:hypothetical protein
MRDAGTEGHFAPVTGPDQGVPRPLPSKTHLVQGPTLWEKTSLLPGLLDG